MHWEGIKTFITELDLKVRNNEILKNDVNQIIDNAESKGILRECAKLFFDDYFKRNKITVVEKQPPPPPPHSKISIPCGVGSNDYGFEITGIREENLCHHPLADVYAVVFAYLQKSLNAKPGIYIKQVEELKRVNLDYAKIYRLQMVVLLLIKNNYVQDDKLLIAYDGATLDIETAIGHVNYMAALFCKLAGISYRKLVISNESNNIITITFEYKNNSLHISNLKQPSGKARKMWFGRNLKYHITDDHINDLLIILQESFGYTQFKTGQYECLQNMLNHQPKNTLCILPTSSGKSLIFYFIALLRSCPTFVVCPTKVLIDDQKRNLEQAHGIDDVEIIESNQDFSSYFPSHKFNYLTALTFLEYNLILRLTDLNHDQFMGNVVLDEVHCISNWSHNFRPEYLMLSYNLRNFVDRTGYSCFTATANYTVVNDLQHQLEIHDDHVFCPVSFYRENFKFNFISCSNSNDIFIIAVQNIVDFLKAHNRSDRQLLVYVRTSYESQELITRIDKEFRSKIAYYIKNDHLSIEEFSAGKYKVLIADADMGIGVNLPYVTDTLHLGIPVCKAQYVQEFGRAGRDNQNCTSTVIYMARDAFQSDDAIFLKEYGSTRDIFTQTLESSRWSDIIAAHNILFAYFSKFRSFDDIIDRVKFLYNSFLDITEGCKRPSEIDTKQYMFLLYVFFRIGFIHRWYTVENFKQEDTTRSNLFFIDPFGAKYDYRNFNNLQHSKRTAEFYLIAMDQTDENKDTIYNILNSESIPEIIEHFLEWFFDKLIYHHRKQLLFMLDFLEEYRNEHPDTILKSLGNYLMCLKIFDAIKEIEKLPILYIPVHCTDSIRCHPNFFVGLEEFHSHSKSIRIAFAYFYVKFLKNGTVDTSLLESIVAKFDLVEFSEFMMQVHEYYKVLKDDDKILFINLLCKYGKVSLFRIVDTLYDKIEKDYVYYLLIAMIVNRKMGLR